MCEDGHGRGWRFGPAANWAGGGDGWWLSSGIKGEGKGMSAEGAIPAIVEYFLEG